MRLPIKKLGLTAKFIPPVLGLNLVALLLVSWVLVMVVDNSTVDQTALSKRALQTEQAVAKAVEEANLIRKADSLGGFLAKTAPDLILGFDFSTLKEYQAGVMKDEDVLYAAFLQPDGSTFTEYKPSTDKSVVIEKRYEIMSDGERLGTVLLGMSKIGINKRIEEGKNRIVSTIDELHNFADASMSNFIGIIAVSTTVILLSIGLLIHFLFKSVITAPLSITQENFQALADGRGDLTVRLPAKTMDEVSQLERTINDFLEQLHKIISDVANNVGSLTNESNRLGGTGSDLSKQADSQRMQTAQVAAAATELTASSEEVVNNGKFALEFATKAKEESVVSNKVVRNSINSLEGLATELDEAASVIKALEQNTDSIGNILDVIKGIAEQTNLLALNAAIEAARAGEHGRGFAVVADEVRTLASRTQESTQEIEQLIENLQSGSSDAVRVMSQSRDFANKAVEESARAGESLDNIEQAVVKMGEMNDQILTAAQEQLSVSNEIQSNVESIKVSSETVSSSAEEAAQSSQSLGNLAQQLSGLTGKFKL